MVCHGRSHCLDPLVRASKARACGSAFGPRPMTSTLARPMPGSVGMTFATGFGQSEKTKLCWLCLEIVGLLSLGLLLLPSAGCSSSHASPPGGDEEPSHDCAEDDEAFINLGCDPIVAPAVNTTGSCTGYPDSVGGDVLLVGHDAGTCHVQIIFESGATSSVDVDFIVVPPSGACDEGFVTVGPDGSVCGVPGACQVSLPEPLCGPEAESSD